MNIIKELTGMGKIFPEKLTMADIHKMKRRDLTFEEKDISYSKYFDKKMADIPAADLKMVNNGPADPSDIITIHERNRMIEPGYHNVETGYTVFPDGSSAAATNVKMPGVTPKMLDWWFNWHPLVGLRYAIWCPVAHVGIDAKDKNAHLDSSGVDLKERNYGKVHYPLEGFDVPGAQRVRIEFFSPEDYGLDMTKFKEPNIARAYLANCLVDQFSIPINAFFHAVRKVKGGVEFRSRYWLGYSMKKNSPVRRNRFIPEKIMMHMARNNCIHSLTEYNNLASFLPQLYKEMGGKIT